MESTPEPLKEILEELFSLLESLETQSLALTQFLKDQGIATDEKLAPYLDRAGNASSVKWRAARARMQYLLSPVPKQEKNEEKDKNKKPEKSPAEMPSGEQQSTEKQSTEKPSTERSRSGSSNVSKDTARNADANTAGKQKAAQGDAPKKSETRQKSKDG